MKKAILFFACCMIAMAASATKFSEKVYVTLADSTKFEGYTSTHLINYLRPDVSKISISREEGGNETEYTSEQVAELVFPPSEGDSIFAVYHPVRAQKYMPNAWKKSPKTYKKPIFLRMIYNGENVKGYVRPALDTTNTPSMSVNNYSWIYYYKLNDEDIAKAYWFATRDLIFGMRKVMKFYFREFPGIVKLIDDGVLDPSDFRENPSIVLPLIDAELASRKQ
ncbi:MAG: hypothetical protein K2G15_01970 [Muribaculaceae bacterium]|nr:hypothetical protein [Muribaculaceae bacterium]